MLIELTNSQFTHACKIGELRQSEALEKNLPDKHGFDGVSGLSIHIEGACGELAAALALNIPWDATVNTFKNIADLSSNIEIRTRSKATYDLIVRADDKDTSLFILVLRLGPKKFDVVGWISGKDAKDKQWSKDYGNRPKAYFVPQSVLKNIQELPI